MTVLLWLSTYFLMGFLTAVVCERFKDHPTFQGVGAPPLFMSLLFWWCVLTLLFIWTIDDPFHRLIRACARRIP